MTLKKYLKLRLIYKKQWGKLFLFMLFSGLLIFLVACEKEEEQADFTPSFSYEFVEDNYVRFTNTSQGNYYSLIWDFGNGTGDTTTNKNKSYVIYYPLAGTYTATLQIADNAGANKSSSKAIAIENTDEIDVTFTFEINQDEPNFVTLTNTTEVTWDSFKWVYRDIEIENLMQHAAYFPLGGDYDINLVIVIDGAAFTGTQSITIGADDPAMTDGVYWSDEFEYTGLPNPANWNMETGGDGWGNNELQFYTNNQSNVSVNNGILTIKAKQEYMGGRNYTSARITTQDKFDIQYGRIEARIKLPKGQGLWPAFWMLGSSFSTIGWPNCGEIDIMEMVGGDSGGDNTTYSTLHWDNDGNYATFGESYTLPSGILADDFHLFAAEWDEQTIKGFIDDVEYFVIDITSPEMSEFHENFFIILNVAVGGNWPGPPDASTQFPQTMQVEYVRVYQDE